MACKYCTISEGKKGSIVYSDQTAIGFLSETPATIGHLVVAPRQHLPIMEAMNPSDAGHLFKIVNGISIALFEAIKSEGTNVIIHNGIEAGQEEPHFSVNIISRTSEDNLMFQWTPKQLGEQEMAAIELKLKSELQKKEEKTPPAQERTPTEPQEQQGQEENQKSEEANQDLDDQEKEENYLIKQLRRMP